MLPQLSKYRAVVTYDTEFRQQPNLRHVEPVCLCATDIISGQKWQVWAGGQPQNNPLPTGPDVLYVCYAATAEHSYFLARGWNLPENILDLYAFHKLQANGYQEFHRGKMRDLERNLLGMMAENGLAFEAYTPEEKEHWRKLIRRGGPYTTEEQQGILDYCSADERDLQLLLPILLPQMDLNQQLLLGDFTRVLAWMEFNGIPVDIKMCNRLWRAWPKILLGLVRRCEAENNYNVFRFDKEGAHLDEKLYVELIVREGLQDEWPQSKTGKYSKSISKKRNEQPNLRTMANKYPRFRAFFEVVELLQNYKRFEPPIGPDGRWRAPNVPWRQKTGRVTPKDANLFRMHSWFRFLIKPPAGRAVAYIDLMSAEYGVGGLLSGDEQMMETYRDVIEGRAESPYLVTGKKMGMIPQDADKKHPRYKLCKSAELAMMFGQTPQGCAEANNIGLDVAEEFHAGHRKLYHTYWSYTDWRIREARGAKRMSTPLGYYINVNRTVQDNTLLNWPMQATCAEIMRLATSRMVDEGLSICVTVHDAVLLEAPLEDIEQHVEIAKNCWRWASERVLKFRMDADAKIVRYPDQYTDEDGTEAWNQMVQFLEEIEKNDERTANAITYKTEWPALCGEFGSEVVTPALLPPYPH
jgi:DNA polymerase-1